MGLRALNDNLILERDEIKKYEGTIVLPDIYAGAIEKVSPTGTIISLGKDVTLDVKVGDKVYFQQFGGSNLKYGDKNYVVINEKELIGTYD